MLVTGNSEVALWRAAEILYTQLSYKHTFYKSVSEVAIDLGKTIRSISDKPEGYFMATGGWHAIRLLEHDPEDEEGEAIVYIGINVLEYQLNPKFYHYVSTPGKEWEYIDTPEIAEDDRV